MHFLLFLHLNILSQFQTPFVNLTTLHRVDVGRQGGRWRVEGEREGGGGREGGRERGGGRKKA